MQKMPLRGFLLFLLSASCDAAAVGSVWPKEELVALPNASLIAQSLDKSNGRRPQKNLAGRKALARGRASAAFTDG